jgi:hypothetical protein
MNRGPGTGTVHSSHGRQVKAIDARLVFRAAFSFQRLGLFRGPRGAFPAADARAVLVDVVMVRNFSLAGLGFGVETSKKLPGSTTHRLHSFLRKATSQKTGKKGKGGRD